METIDTKDSARFKKVDEGDDGIVLVDTLSNTALKLFVSKTTRDRDLPKSTEANMIKAVAFHEEISRDQAIREIKAMTLLKDHDNFLKLESHTFTSIQLIEGDERRVPVIAPCIKMSFEPNLFQLNHVIALFGFKPGENFNQQLAENPHLFSQHSMIFEDRNVLFKHLMNQMYDAVVTMHGMGIYHRDLDLCNVKMKLPGYQLKIMDFARADVPDVDSFPRSENPLSIIASSKRMSRLLQNGTPDEKWIARHLWDYCINQYENPINNNTNLTNVPLYKEYSDCMATAHLFNRVLQDHLHSFQWSQNSSSEETTIQENDLLARFVAHCNTLTPLQAKALTHVDPMIISRISQADVQWGVAYIKCIFINEQNVRITNDQKILKHPRWVKHSNAWLHVYREKQPTLIPI
jgi:serine/threonine protein kinase